MLRIFSRLITEKVNPKWIWKQHFATLVDGSGHKHKQDYITFFILPVIPAVICKLLGATLDNDMVNIINTALALFAGLFLSVSIQLIGIDRSKLGSAAAIRVRKQTVSTISFLILLALVTMLLSYLSLFEGVSFEWAPFPYSYFKDFIDIIVYALLGTFMLTVLMVLKRTASLFDNMNNQP